MDKIMDYVKSLVKAYPRISLGVAGAAALVLFTTVYRLWMGLPLVETLVG